MRIAPGATIALTGMSGFVGGVLAPKLLAAGYRVRALGRHSTDEPFADQRLTSVERAFVNLATPDTITANALEGCDALIHLAARIPRDHNDPSEAAKCMTVNALGTLQLMRAATDAGIKTVTHAVSGNAYRFSHQPRREDDALFPGARAYFYLTSKIAEEILVANWAAAHGVRLCCLRLGSVYGPEQENLITRWLRAGLGGDPIQVANGGVYGVDFTWCDDVALAIMATIDREIAGPFNVGSGARTTTAELARLVVEATGASPDLIETAPLTADNDLGFAALDVTRARAAFDFAPTPLRVGIERLAEALRSSRLKTRRTGSTVKRSER